MQVGIAIIAGALVASAALASTGYAQVQRPQTPPSGSLTPPTHNAPAAQGPSPEAQARANCTAAHQRETDLQRRLAREANPLERPKYEREIERAREEAARWCGPPPAAQ